MGVKDKGLWERILYRYIYIGTVEREGKLYKKYEKVSRFKNPKKIFRIIVIMLLLLLISSLVLYLMRVGSEAVF
jgi:hypothetical protein